MRRVLSYILILVISINSFGNLIVFRYLQTRIKKEIKREIKSLLSQNLDNKDLELISVSKENYNRELKFLEEKEFLYDNKMYDIVFKRETKDSIFYYCINDTKEKQLFDNIEGTIANFLDSDNPLAVKAKKLLQIFTFDALIKLIDKKIFRFYTILNNIGMNESIIFNIIDIPTPPPKP